ncbi:MAG: signal peptide peptidase SppA [Candidatus Cloacimonadales bacterium]
MKKGAYFGFGCLTSVLLVVLLVTITIVSSVKMIKKDVVVINNNSLLTLDISGPIVEYSRFANDRFFNNQTTVFDIIDAIKKAKNDPRIDGILLKPELVMCGYASLNEIIEAIEDFKSAKKVVISYITIASNADLLLASTADEIVISSGSSAGIFLRGFGVDMAFYKNMLDKIGVEMHVISAGKFKDYGTQYSKDYMSEETKANLNRVLKSRYELYVNQLSEQLNVSSIVIESIINEEKYMFLDPKETIMTGMVQRSAFESAFKKEQEQRFKHVIDSKKYLLGFKAKDNKKLNEKIAVLYLNGNIMPVGNDFSVLSSKWINETVEDILKNKSIKGCVLRVNSGGGSALESEEILEILKQLKEKMPVVVSMGDVAASGGYMISMAGDKVYADPYTVTGSIGVVQIVPDAKKLQDKLGVTHEKLEYGKKSTWLNPLNGVSDKQKSAMKASADVVYDSFKKIVMNGRSGKFNTLEEVEAVAQGQVWDALTAKENGLIDEIGSLKDAINEAARLATVTEYSRQNYPTRKDFFQLFLTEKMGLAEMKSILLKGTSETLYQQKLMLDNFTNHSMQTILPVEFEK